MAYDHLILLNDYLLDLAARKIRRLIVTMPPQHGKSEMCSRFFPAWYMGTFPEHRLILTSYESSYAENWSRAVRDLMVEHGPDLWDLHLRGDSQSVKEWRLRGHKGRLKAAGAGGPITGASAELAIIDDPIKNEQEAFSPTYRERLWSWYKMTLRTRVQQGGLILLIMTRWHEDDLAGRLLAQADNGGMDWTVLNLPHRSKGADIDPLGRPEGAPLCPELHDDEDLRQIEQDVGPYVISAMYEGNPAPETGGLLKRHWWRLYDALPARFDRVIISVDAACKDKPTSDNTAVHAYGELGPDIYLIARDTAKRALSDTIQAVEIMAARLKARGYTVAAVLIEDKANGPEAIRELRKTIPGVIAINPAGGKTARAIASQPALQSGNSWVPAPGVEGHADGQALISEAARFPAGANDDDVDAYTQAVIWLRAHAPSSFTPPEDSQPMAHIPQHW